MRSKKEIENYQNEFNRKNYDRVNIVIQKGRKEIWQIKAKQENLSLNSFVTKIIEQYIKNMEKQKLYKINHHKRLME